MLGFYISFEIFYFFHLLFKLFSSYFKFFCLFHCFDHFYYCSNSLEFQTCFHTWFFLFFMIFGFYSFFSAFKSFSSILRIYSTSQFSIMSTVFHRIFDGEKSLRALVSSSLRFFLSSSLWFDFYFISRIFSTLSIAFDQIGKNCLVLISISLLKIFNWLVHPSFSTFYYYLTKVNPWNPAIFFNEF